MNKNKLFLLCIAVMVLACGALSVSADTAAQWDGYYCTSGGCGVNTYSYNYGYNGYYCTANYVAPFQAEFIRDVTYPDGTYVMPGSTFTKTWRIRNVGTQAWTTDMKLVYVAGDSMSAVGTNIPYYVAPGYSVDISVNLIAPTYGGTVSGQWMLQAPDGTLFGVGCNGQTPIWVSVKTWTNGTCSCLGQPTCNCTGPSYRSGRNPYCNNKIRSIEDVTYPDGTVVAPGATIRKTWRMKNGGTCVWDENYIVSFFYGDDLGFDGTSTIIHVGDDDKSTSGPKYQVNRAKKINVYPDEYVYVTIDLKAPTTPGMYEAYFKLRDNYGYEFGFGSYADSAFWVNIVVSDKASKSAEEDGTIAKDLETAEVSSVENANADIALTNIEAAEAAVVENTANKCGEQAIAMRATDTGYEVLWSAVNDGTATWDGYTLVMSDSNPALRIDAESIAVPTTASGETAEVSFNLTIDDSAETTDPLWAEFYMNAGDEGFCEFYFEAPAK